MYQAPCQGMEKEENETDREPGLVGRKFKVGRKTETKTKCKVNSKIMNIFGMSFQGWKPKD